MEEHMKKYKSHRNKTIDFNLSTGKKYLKELVKANEITDLSSVINMTICGDSFEVLSLLPEKSVDLLIVDPPYNLTKNYHGHVFDKQNSEEYTNFTRKWVEKTMRLLKDTGTMYVCCDWESSIVIGQILSEYFIIQNRITWQREKGRGAKRNWKNSMEDIWFVTLSNDYVFNVDDVKVRKKVIAPYRKDGKPKDWEETSDGNFRNSHPSNFWDDITIPYWSMPENTAHPTQKPEKLIAKLILASSNEGDVILDPFLGSGTTSVVAKKLNRKYIGIEQNKQYCAWAQYRLELADSESQIQGYTDGVFWERNTLNIQNKIKNKKKDF